MPSPQVSIAFSASAEDYLRRTAAARGVSMSFLIREIVDLHRHGDTGPLPAQPTPGHMARRAPTDPLAPRC
jgi:hypothetical protein